jgi:RecB family endonuclease NucS
MRLVIATCTVDYAGRLSAHLPLANRLLMLKGDGSILVHSDSGSYKPLNWMNPPCTITIQEPDEEQVAKGVIEVWRVSQAKTADILYVSIHEILSELEHNLGEEPGLQKDGVEAHLQEMLAEQLHHAGTDLSLIRREYFTAIGPVDILAKDANGETVAIEIKRRLELLNRDPQLRPVRGIFAAQEIKPQARTLAEDRGIECVVLDYDLMRGHDTSHNRLF